jgi:uncharacterized protein (DUF2147 family)
MKKILHSDTYIKFVLAALISGVFIAVAADNPPWHVADVVEGVWRTENYETKQPELIVKVWSMHDTLFGMVTGFISNEILNDPVCRNCPDSLNNAPLEGMKILWGLTKGENGWKKGKMIDISDGKVYKCELQLNEKGELEVFSYSNRIFKVGRTYVWQRVR